MRASTVVQSSYLTASQTFFNVEGSSSGGIACGERRAGSVRVTVEAGGLGCGGIGGEVDGMSKGFDVVALQKV